jgi:hypothetical protein
MLIIHKYVDVLLLPDFPRAAAKAIYSGFSELLVSQSGLGKHASE